MFLGKEPVVIAAAVRALILAGTAFGLDWTGEQVAAIMLAVEAVLALLVRQNVTSDSTLIEAGTSRQTVTAIAAEARAAEDKSS